MKMGASISLDGVASVRIVGASAFVIFPLHHKTKKMVSKNMIAGNTPTHTGGGNPARKQHNSAKAESCVQENLRANKLQKTGDFGSEPGMLTH